MASLVHGALPREPEELAEVAPHPDVDHVLGVEVGGDEEPLVKDARAYDIELPGQVVKVVRVVLEVGRLELVHGVVHLGIVVRWCR